MSYFLLYLTLFFNSLITEFLPLEIQAKHPVPELTKIFIPAYPALGLRGRIESMVVVSYTIDKDGKIKSPEIQNGSGNPIFNECVKRALGEWQHQVPQDQIRRNKVTFVFLLTGDRDKAGGLLEYPNKVIVKGFAEPVEPQD
jgi:TonB family protein